MEDCLKFLLKISDYDDVLPCGDLCYCWADEMECADEVTARLICQIEPSTTTPTTTTTTTTTPATTTTTARPQVTGRVSRFFSSQLRKNDFYISRIYFFTLKTLC